MSFEYPYPNYAYLKIDPETNDKRWFGSKGMGVVGYVHEDRVDEYIAAAVKAERERCARIIEKLAGGADAVYPAGVDMMIEAVRNPIN